MSARVWGVALVLGGLGCGTQRGEPAVQKEPAAKAKVQAPKAPALIATPAKDLRGDALPRAANARLGAWRFVHSRGANDVAFSKDGAILATVAGQGGSYPTGPNTTEVRLWDTRDGRLIKRLAMDKPDRMMWHVAISPDGQLLAAGDSQLFVWDVASGKQRYRKPLDGDTIEQLSFSPDGSMLAIASTNHATSRHGPEPSTGLWLLNAADGKEIVEFGDKYVNGATGLAFAPNGKELAFTVGTRVHFLDLAKKKRVRSIKFSLASKLAFTHDGATIWSSAHNGIYSIPSKGGKVTRAASPQSGVGGVALASHADIGAIQHEGRVAVIKPSTGAEEESFPTLGTAGIALSPDGKKLAVFGGTRQVELIEIESKKRIASERHVEAVETVAFSPDGTLIATGGRDYAVRVWESSGKLLKTLPMEVPPKPVAPLKRIVRVAFRPDGSQLAVLGASKAIRIYSTRDWTELRRLKGHAAVPTDFVWLKSGGLISAAGAELFQWDLSAASAQKKQIELPSGVRATTLAMAPDEDKLFVSGPGAAAIIDLDDGESIPCDMWGQGVVDATWRRNSIFVATVNSPHLIEPATCSRRELSLTGHHVMSVDISPDGEYLAWASWSAPSLAKSSDGKALVPLDPTPNKRNSRAQSVAFSPDQRRIAVGYIDGEVIVYSTEALLTAKN